ADEQQPVTLSAARLSATETIIQLRQRVLLRSMQQGRLRQSRANSSCNPGIRFSFLVLSCNALRHCTAECRHAGVIAPISQRNSIGDCEDRPGALVIPKRDAAISSIGCCMGRLADCEHPKSVFQRLPIRNQHWVLFAIDRMTRDSAAL